MRRILATILLLTFGASACSDTSPSAPTPAPLNLTGTWTGDLSLQGTPTRMTWTVTHTNNSVDGPVLVLLPNGVVLMNGTLAGTISGSVVTYTIAVSRGGIPTQPACTGQLAGTVTATVAAVSTLTGSYAVSSSTCTTPFSSGNFTLTKQ